MSWEDLADGDFDVDALLGSDDDNNDNNDDLADAGAGGSGGKSKWAAEEEADAAALAAEQEAQRKKEEENAALRAQLGEAKVGGKRAERIKEKQKAAQAAIRAKEGPGEDAMTAADRQRAVEAADFQHAEDLFGGLEGAINTKNPKSEADFTELAKLMSIQLVRYQNSRYYGHFLKELVRGCSENLDPVELKDISSAVQTLANSKIQDQAKAAGKGKKKGKVKVNIKMERGVDDGLGTDAPAEEGGNTYEDDFDFM